MGIDDLIARLDQLLSEHGLSGARRPTSGALRDALGELKAGLRELEEGLERTARDLAGEREHLETAERRGRMAAEIDDRETAEVATRFVARHRERVLLLERKHGVQQDELAMVQREYDELVERYGQAGPDGIPADPPPSVPGEDPDLLRLRLNKQAAEAAATAQLELLKKKMGKPS